MTIFNMVGWGSWGGWWVIVPLEAIDDLNAKSGNAEATITWTDPTNPVYNWVTLVSWSSTVLVRKTWSAPSNSSDWTVVVTETTRNQYSSSWYVDTWLTNWTTYYYAAFAIWDNGTESAISNTVSVIPDPNYLCFTANTAWSTIQLTKVWSPNAATFETSTDQDNWTAYTIWDTITLSNIWDKVYWRNRTSNMSSISSSWTNYFNYVMTGSIAASWNLNYLQRKKPILSLWWFCFSWLFKWCTSLTTAPELPATTLGKYCYQEMFYWCTALTTAPELPATTLPQRCYYSMFQWCTALTTVPESLGGTLGSAWDTCCWYMFASCTSLTSWPELPATTISGESCYTHMFDGCTALASATEELPATTLTQSCYASMFKDCTALTTVPKLPATTLSVQWYYYMFQWCTSLVTLPELPATTFPNYCYNNMFKWCTGIKLSATQTWDYQTPYMIPSWWSWTAWATNSTQGMFSGTWWTFTWAPTINTTYYTSNTVITND